MEPSLAFHWDGGLSTADLTTIPCVGSEIDELALIYEIASASSSSSATTPSVPPFAYHSLPLVSNNTSPSALSSPAVPSLDATTQDRKRKRDREKNTEAARRYRKRRVDETEDLRDRLEAMTRERDELKLKLVKAETEVDLLRGLVGQSKSK